MNKENRTISTYKDSFSHNSHPIICSHLYATTIDSRQSSGYRRRRYSCPECRLRWTTLEIEVPKTFSKHYAEVFCKLISKISTLSLSRLKGLLEFI